MIAALKCYANTPEAKKAAADEAKAVRQAAKVALAAVQGPRSALLFFKLDCEAVHAHSHARACACMHARACACTQARRHAGTHARRHAGTQARAVRVHVRGLLAVPRPSPPCSQAIGEAADPQMELEEVTSLLQEAFDELPEGERAWYEQRAARDAKRYEREKKRKRAEAKDEGGGGQPREASKAPEGEAGGEAAPAASADDAAAEEGEDGADENAGADENRDTQQEGAVLQTKDGNQCSAEAAAAAAAVSMSCD